MGARERIRASKGHVKQERGFVGGLAQVFDLCSSGSRPQMLKVEADGGQEDGGGTAGKEELTTRRTCTVNEHPCGGDFLSRLLSPRSRNLGPSTYLKWTPSFHSPIYLMFNPSLLDLHSLCTSFSPPVFKLVEHSPHISKRWGLPFISHTFHCSLSLNFQGHASQELPILCMLYLPPSYHRLSAVNTHPSSPLPASGETAQTKVTSNCPGVESKGLQSSRLTLPHLTELTTPFLKLPFSPWFLCCFPPSDLI